MGSIADGSGTHTLYPGIYNKGITIQGGTVTFAPGIYFVSGKPLALGGGATVLGSGVMFYTYNGGSLAIQNPTTTVTMSAPTSWASTPRAATQPSCCSPSSA